MSRFDLVIFDYDGVIADSEVLNNQAMAEVLTGIGLPTTLDEALATYMGRRWLDCRPDIEVRLGRACPETTLGDWTRLCHQRAASTLTAVPGAAAFMAELAQPRCIASSSPPDWIELGLQTMGIGMDHAGPIYSGAIHVTRGKPHPDLFLHAAADLEVKPRRTLVIEDSPAGVQAGVAAGMTVVGLLAGGHVRPGHAERLSAAGAHFIAHDYDSVRAFMA
ncbi:HAD family hydrolase [Brevundimonas sp. VNH65]|uniref:HAD family hydrolase n=1 Tax=Brevundimonas sp. VNH65 TaxID=3400917 RepID=UPI003C0F6BF7